MRTSRPGRGLPRRVMRRASVSSQPPVQTVPAASVMPKLPTCNACGIAAMIGSATPGGCTAKLLFISLTRDRSVSWNVGWYTSPCMIVTKLGIQGCDLVLLEHLQRDARVEVPHREVRAADVEDREHRQHGGDVEHRQRRPHAVVVRQPVAMASERDAVAHHRLVRDQAAFRVGRGARGVEHQADVAHPHAQARAMHFHLVAGLGGGVEVGCGEIALRLGLAEQHDVAQLRRTRHLELARVAAARKFLERAVQALDEIDGIGDGVRRDDGDDVAVLDDVGELVRLVPGVDRHDDATAERDREERFDEFRARVHQQADVVARPHPKRLQRARAAQRAVDQLPVGEGAIGEHERE